MDRLGDRSAGGGVRLAWLCATHSAALAGTVLAALAVGLFWWGWRFALYRDSYLLRQRRRFISSPTWAANTHPDVLKVLLPSVDGGSLPGGSKGWLYQLMAACLFELLNRRFYFVR